MTLSKKTKYLPIVGKLANLKKRNNVIEINVTITVQNPASRPKMPIMVVNTSSAVEGILRFETSNFSGNANLTTFVVAVMENNTNKIKENTLACRFRLGNLLLIPRPKMAP